MTEAIAVLDIGMTNKKVVLYSLDLKQLEEHKRTFPPQMVDGLETHDLEAIEAWFLAVLQDCAARWRIRAIAVSTHGATFVCTDEEGRPVAPCIYYTHEPGPDFHARFYALAGERITLQKATGTPDFAALINPAKGLFFLSERCPEALSTARYILPYPQYWGMRFAGLPSADSTYVGCHTYLFDWLENGYSTVADRLGIRSKLPTPIRSPWEVLGTIKPEIASRTGLKPDTIVTLGIHDSNASIIPHMLIRKGRDFVLNSTGTWCVLMHPVERYGFEPDELGKVVFFNRSAWNTPIKTAIFLGGKEHETWANLIARSARRSAALPAPGIEDFRSVLAEKSCFILPEIVPGSGQFPGSAACAVEHGVRYSLDSIEKDLALPHFMNNNRKALAVLTISLVMQTLVALERTGLSAGTEILTEGGFRNNAEYNSLLASALPQNRVCLTDLREATSFGTALTALSALGGLPPEQLASFISIEEIPVHPMPVGELLGEYRQAWQQHITGGAR